MDRERGAVGEDCFGGVDVVEGVVGDLIIGLIQFVDDFSDAVKDFGAEIG